jgi:chromosome segregation ATPase
MLTRILAGGPVVACMVLAFCTASAADLDRLKLNALLQESDLLLEEVGRLEPVSQQLAQDGQALEQTERELREATPALDADIRKYNSDLAALEKAVGEQKARCPKESTNRTLVESCNARVEELRAENKRLTEERDKLRVRRTELNQRIERFNQERQDWTNRRQVQDKRIVPNRTDVEYWVQRAGDFLATPAFKTLAANAGEPAACAPETVGGLKELYYWEALKRAAACLRAVRAGLPPE